MEEFFPLDSPHGVFTGSAKIQKGLQFWKAAIFVGIAEAALLCMSLVPM